MEEKTAGEARPRYPFDRQIGPALRRTANEMKRCFDAGLEDCGLTGIRGAILGYLCHNPGDIYQRDLEKRFNMRRSTATALLQGLEEQGLLRREPVEHDARLKRLQVTPQGREVEAGARRFLDELETRMRQNLSEQEIAQLLELLGRVRANLGGSAEPCAPPKASE